MSNVKSKEMTLTDKVGLAQRLGQVGQKDAELDSPVIEIGQSEIYEAFKKFIDRKLPKTDHLEFLRDEIIVEVFSMFKPYSGLIDVGGKNYGRTVNFSIGRVIACGPESQYAVGDIVKLKDYDVATIPNPAYEAWANNPYSKSNATRVGQEPPRYLDNLQMAYGSKLFRINPLKLELSGTEMVTFKLNNPNIECRVRNVADLAS